MTVNDAYRTLGLAQDATPSQVKSAYRRLIAEAHPDRGGEAATFIRIRVAYEILAAFLHQSAPEDDIAIPAELRAVIDRIVSDFKQHQRWAEGRTQEGFRILEAGMSAYIQKATRTELRQFSGVFRTSWDATLNAIFTDCNDKCDSILQSYESWCTDSTQAVYDDLYRRELWHFPLRRRFWEIFLFIAALAGALTVVVGWRAPDRWFSAGIMVFACVLSFLVYRWACRRSRNRREPARPLSVVPFQLQDGARFQTETTMRRGTKATAAAGVAGLFMGSAASGGFAVPLLGAVAGMTVGGLFDRLVNPTGRMKEGMQEDLRRFMAMAAPQVTTHVLQVHQALLEDVRGRIVTNYQERVRDTVKLLTAGGSAPPARRNGGRGRAERPKSTK